MNFVSLNIGMDMDSFENVIRVLACLGSTLPRILTTSHAFALSVDDVIGAKASGKLAIAFDFEGSFECPRAAVAR